MTSRGTFGSSFGSLSLWFFSPPLWVLALYRLARLCRRAVTVRAMAARATHTASTNICRRTCALPPTLLPTPRYRLPFLLLATFPTYHLPLCLPACTTRTAAARHAHYLPGYLTRLPTCLPPYLRYHTTFLPAYAERDI